MNTTQDHTISRRKQKAKAEKAKRANPSKACTFADAAIRSSRARRFHQLLRTSGRGGLTAKGAAQLQHFFSKKVPESEKLSLSEMDSSATMILLQMAAEEVDNGHLIYEELRRVTEQNFMANRAENGGGEGVEGSGKVEEGMETEEVLEAKEGMGSKKDEEDEEQGGVALAKDL